MSTPKVYKRQLSSFDASQCAAAKGKVCTCRCGGALHGKNHENFMAGVRTYLDDVGEISRETSEELARTAALTLDDAEDETTKTHSRRTN